MRTSVNKSNIKMKESEFPQVVQALQAVSWMLLSLLLALPLFSFEASSLARSSFVYNAPQFDVWARAGVARGAAGVSLARDVLREATKLLGDLDFQVSAVDFVTRSPQDDDDHDDDDDDNGDFLIPPQRSVEKIEKPTSPAFPPTFPLKLQQTQKQDEEEEEEEEILMPRTVEPTSDIPTKPPTKQVSNRLKKKQPKTKWVVVSRNNSFEHTLEHDAAIRKGFGITETTMKRPWFSEPSEKARQRAMQEDVMRKSIKRIAEQALAKLEEEGISCVPAFCDEPAGFYMEEMDKLFLSSFPGSGNTWVRAAIRAGTRKYTGSLYKDWRLEKFQHFRGEMLDPNDVRTSIVKSHWPMWGQGSPREMPNFKGAIYFVRSPFDAILAELNRALSGEIHNGVALREKLQSAEAKRRAVKLAQEYTEGVAFWQGLNAFDHRNGKLKIFEGNGVKNYTGTLVSDMTDMFSFDIRPMRHGAGFPVFTMFYEDLKRDFVVASAHLLAFLKAFHSDRAPPVFDSLVCILRKHQTFSRTKRATTTLGNDDAHPFDAATTKKMCDFFTYVWNEHKWGECGNMLQREREARGEVEIERAWQLWELPENACVT